MTFNDFAQQNIKQLKKLLLNCDIDIYVDDYQTMIYMDDFKFNLDDYSREYDCNSIADFLLTISKAINNHVSYLQQVSHDLIELGHKFKNN